MQCVHTHLILVHIQYLPKNQYWYKLELLNYGIQFEIYLDTTDGNTLINTIDFESTTTSIDVSVENNTIYYWKVVATDAEGNQSDSGVYSFRTN